MKKAPKDYAAAQAELQTLLAALQQPDVAIDALTDKVQRARELIEWSRARLRTTEEEVEGLLGTEGDA